jgi:hypothetical protein
LGVVCSGDTHSHPPPPAPEITDPDTGIDTHGRFG